MLTESYWGVVSPGWRTCEVMWRQKHPDENALLLSSRQPRTGQATESDLEPTGTPNEEFRFSCPEASFRAPAEKAYHCPSNKERMPVGTIKMGWLAKNCGEGQSVPSSDLNIYYCKKGERERAHFHTCGLNCLWDTHNLCEQLIAVKRGWETVVMQRRIPATISFPLQINWRTRYVSFH